MSTIDASRLRAMRTAILERVSVGPVAAGVHAVAVLAVEILRIGQEAEAALDEVLDSAIWVRLAGCDDEDACHVVGAVAVLAPRFGELGVLEGSVLVGEVEQVLEARLWRGGHTSAARSRRRRFASCR